LIEHVRPLSRGNAVHALCAGLARAVRSKLDAGERSQGAIGWAIVMVVGVGTVMLAESIADSLHPLFVFTLHVFVLYCTIGFRQFSKAFAEIRIALAADDVEGARRELDDWIAGEAFDAPLQSVLSAGKDPQPGTRVPPGVDLPPTRASRTRAARVDKLRSSSSRAYLAEAETCRRAIAHALVAAHRHVLGPLFAYVLIPGAIGPVIYRLAAMLARGWTSEAGSRWGDFADRAFAIIDWLPARLTAGGFAVVGNFDDALYCWRGAMSDRAARTDSRVLLLAAGGGALRVRVADAVLQARWAQGERGFECPGDEARPTSLDAAAGLVWRSLMLWLGLFALITISAWMGR
jgi:adenosylcobinamide-phosphate synthase